MNLIFLFKLILTEQKSCKFYKKTLVKIRLQRYIRLKSTTGFPFTLIVVQTEPDYYARYLKQNHNPGSSENDIAGKEKDFS